MKDRVVGPRALPKWRYKKSLTNQWGWPIRSPLKLRNWEPVTSKLWRDLLDNPTCWEFRELPGLPWKITSSEVLIHIIPNGSNKNQRKAQVRHNLKRRPLDNKKLANLKENPHQPWICHSLMRMGNRSKKSSPQNGGEFNGHLPLVEFVKKHQHQVNKSKFFAQNSPCLI